jgi:hypothetical protein
MVVIYCLVNVFLLASTVKGDVTNLTLYVKTYFQSAGTDELAKINNMKFNKVSAFDAYSLMFRKETAPTNVEQGVYSQEFTTLPSVKGS